jgi:hypothetical protein
VSVQHLLSVAAATADSAMSNHNVGHKMVLLSGIILLRYSTQGMSCVTTTGANTVSSHTKAS